ISHPVAVVGAEATQLGGDAGQALEPSAVRLDVSGVHLQPDVLALAQRAGRSTELTIGVSLGCTKAKDRTNRTLGAVGHLELGLQLTPRPHAILLVEVQIRLDLAAEFGLDLGGRRKRQSQHQDETRENCEFPHRSLYPPHLMLIGAALRRRGAISEAGVSIVSSVLKPCTPAPPWSTCLARRSAN